MVSAKFHLAFAAANLLLLGALVLGNANATAEMAPAGVVRAKLIELVNDAGEMRAQLHLTEDGGGELRLRSPQGEIRVKLGASDDGAILLMLDKSTEPGARLATEASGPTLKFSDPAKGERVLGP